MKVTTPTTPPIKTGGSNDPEWMAILFAVSTISACILFAYIIAHSHA